jgi:hypothetical protein
VADTFDAVTSTRPYRGAARHERAIEILRQASGSQLDPAAVRAFIAYYSGHRVAVAWEMACATPRRIIGWLNGEALAAPVSSGKLATAVVMSAAIASSAAVAPIAVVNAPGLLPPVSATPAHPGHSTRASRPPLAPRRRDGKHGGSSSPPRRLAAPFASANSPTAQPRMLPIGNPAARQVTNPAGQSPIGGPGTTRRPFGSDLARRTARTHAERRNSDLARRTAHTDADRHNRSKQPRHEHSQCAHRPDPRHHRAA